MQDIKINLDNVFHTIKLPDIAVCDASGEPTLELSDLEVIVLSLSLTVEYKGVKPRIPAKITAFTLVQYINKFDFNRPINNLKVAIT